MPDDKGSKTSIGGWLAGLRIAGWLSALAPLIVAGILSMHLRDAKGVEAADTARTWRAAVERIRACRRAGPGPMRDWRVCEEAVLAEDWRDSRNAPSK